jgi:serine/threonine-protein kinase PknG
VYGLLPGEVAPKLALAMTAELAGDLTTADRYYGLVWTADHSHVSAAFGRARVELALANRAGAVAILDSVPAGSIYFTSAQVAAITARIRGNDTPREVIEAGQRLEALGLDAERRQKMEAEVFESALTWTLTGVRAWPTNGAGADADWNGRILGQRPTERELRLGLERTYRTLAHLAKDADDRIALVERANSVRPRTLI